MVSILRRLLQCRPGVGHRPQLPSKRVIAVISLLLLGSLVLLRGRETRLPNQVNVDNNTHWNSVPVGGGGLFTLEYIRKNHLLPYDPAIPTNYSGSRAAWEEHKQKVWKQEMPRIIAERLNFKRNGFFVECGALDGVFISNTLHLEQSYGWGGLLIEADPAPLAILKKRNRHAWVADVCLSPKPYPMKVEMIGHQAVKGHGYIENDVVEGEGRAGDTEYNRKFKVQCFPLSMLMAAIGRREIDYLSLDVEGVELDILKTIPFPEIRIQLISVETRPGNKDDIRQFLESEGYKRIKVIKSESDFMHDDLYELQKL